jgi:hypothetical protein
MLGGTLHAGMGKWGCLCSVLTVLRVQWVTQKTFTEQSFTEGHFKSMFFSEDKAFMQSFNFT